MLRTLWLGINQRRERVCREFGLGGQDANHTGERQAAGGVLNANGLLVGATSHPTSHCMRLMSPDDDHIVAPLYSASKWSMRDVFFPVLPFEHHRV